MSLCLNNITVMQTKIKCFKSNPMCCH